MTPDPHCVTTRLDELMPEWEIRSAHQVEVNASAHATFAACDAVDFGESPIVRWLMALRTLGRKKPPRPRTIEERKAALQRAGFVEIARTENEEVVIGVAGRFWRWDSGTELVAHTAESFREYASPGFVKVAWSYSVRELAYGRSLLCTQTRILCFGDAARRKFKLYWLLVGPFSGLIRREMLRLAKRRAEAVR